MRHLLWIVACAVNGFVVAFAFGDRTWLPVDLYLGIYMASVAGLALAYARATRLDLGGMLRRRSKAALGLGVVFGAAMFRNVYAMPEAGHLTGAALAWALVWRGLFYGAADGVLLLAMPWMIAWRGFRAEGAPLRTKVKAGAVAYAGILFVTAAYHAGYRDFRSSKMAQPLTGNAIAGWATLVSANPAAAPAAHVFMHVGAVLRQPEGGVFLPPHRPQAARPGN